MKYRLLFLYRPGSDGSGPLRPWVGTEIYKSRKTAKVARNTLYASPDSRRMIVPVPADSFPPGNPELATTFHNDYFRD
jgi:phosphoribosyl 1,2-cyclic phosphodiesterase